MNTEIFIITTSLFTGGAERQAIWLANSLHKSGYKVNLMILKKGDELSSLVNENIKISRFQIYSQNSKKLFKLFRLLRLAFLSVLRIRKSIQNSEYENKVTISFMFHSFVLVTSVAITIISISKHKDFNDIISQLKSGIKTPEFGIFNFFRSSGLPKDSKCPLTNSSASLK